MTIAVIIIMRQPIFSGNYKKKTSMIIELPFLLVNLNESLYYKTMQRLIDNVFNVTDTVRLVKFICDKHYTLENGNASSCTHYSIVQRYSDAMSII